VLPVVDSDAFRFIMEVGFFLGFDDDYFGLVGPGFEAVTIPASPLAVCINEPGG